MARPLLCSTFFLISAGVLLASQPQARPEPLEAPQIVEQWFSRWNALDETAETAQAVIELYADDALHSTAPASHQLGTVTFRGHDGIRKMVEDFVAAFEQPEYRIEAVTAREKTARLYNITEGPWGGPSVAVEFVAVYTSRLDGKRYVCPGGAFFQIQDGKIRRLRLYMATGEVAEVEREVKRPPTR